VFYLAAESADESGHPFYGFVAFALAGVSLSLLSLIVHATGTLVRPWLAAILSGVK
jgi:hypothetical protein